MNNGQYTDEELVEMILGSTLNREEALRFIYLTWRSKAIAILRAMSIDIPSAEDAIQEAIVVLDNSIRNGKYKQTGSLENYFIGICKGRLYSNSRSTKRIDWTGDNFKVDGIESREPETLMLEDEQKSIIEKILDSLGEKCKEVLKLYKLSYSYAEIAEEADLSNANNARQKFFQCKKKFRKLVAKNPMFANYFK